MTTREAIREILRAAASPLSLLEIQRLLLDGYGITAMDSIGRRIREMSAAEHIVCRKREHHKNTWEYLIQRGG